MLDAMETFPAQLGARIRAARKAARLSQQQLGEQVGLDQAFVSRLETGLAAGTPAQMMAIAGALGVSISGLMGVEPTVEPVRPRAVRGPQDVLDDPGAPAGLRALAEDRALTKSLRVGELEWRALASIELPAPATKEGYVAVLMAVRGASGAAGPEGRG
jgi:transcriptional regulator with XRE-family HTH domain